MHWYNYIYENKNKISCVTIDDAEYIFVTNSAGFDKEFLEHHELLHFRAHMSSAAVVYAVMKIFEKQSKKFSYHHDYFSALYRDARFLMLAMSEFGQGQVIEIGNEISDSALK